MLGAHPDFQTKDTGTIDGDEDLNDEIQDDKNDEDDKSYNPDLDDANNNPLDDNPDESPEVEEPDSDDDEEEFRDQSMHLSAQLAAKLKAEYLELELDECHTFDQARFQFLVLLSMVDGPYKDLDW